MKLMFPYNQEKKSGQISLTAVMFAESPNFSFTDLPKLCVDALIYERTPANSSDKS
jgi:hypothetical protein